MELRIGAGGWEYFPLGYGDRLKAYSKVFDFVEVNTTFYRRPSLEAIRGWRKSVPPSFEFAVKCSREVTSRLGSAPYSSLVRETAFISRVCDILGARVLVLQTPPWFDANKASLDEIATILERFTEAGITVAWEMRSRPDERFLRFLEEKGVVHSVDLTRGRPAYAHEVLYSRLFGRGEHTLYRFRDTDFDEIEAKLRGIRPKKAYLAFHGVAMYADALRFKRRSLSTLDPS